MASHNHVFAAYEPEPRFDEMIAQVERRKLLEYDRDNIARAVMRGEDNDFFAEEQNAVAVLKVIRNLLQPPLNTLDGARKWDTLHAALEGLASEHATFMTSDK